MCSRTQSGGYDVASQVYCVDNGPVTYSAVDLWLHAVTSSIATYSGGPPLLYGLGQNTCPPHPSPYDGVFRCLYAPNLPGQWEGNTTLGVQVITNTSETMQAITLADQGNLAVLVVPTAPRDMQFTASSLGARASCKPFNDVCLSVDGFNCTTAGYPGLPILPFATDLNNAQTPTSASHTVYIMTADCPNCTYSVQNTVSNSQLFTPPTNPISAWLQFDTDNLDLATWAVHGEKTASGNPVDIPPFNILSLINCSLAFYNVNLGYNTGNYTSQSEELMDPAIADGFSGPTRLGLYNDQLSNNYQTRISSSSDNDTLVSFVEQDLARLALGYAAASIVNLQFNTTSQTGVGQKLLGRYPFWPTVIFMTLLYIYAGVALIVILWALLFPRAYTIRAPTSEESVSALELAHLRLTNPMALVAEALPSTELPGQEGVLSLQTQAMDMFDERYTGEDSRVGVGVHRSVADTTNVFRLWKMGLNGEKDEVEKMD